MSLIVAPVPSLGSTKTPLISETLFQDHPPPVLTFTGANGVDWEVGRTQAQSLILHRLGLVQKLATRLPRGSFNKA